jgi:pyruvate,orthophosphate dikinase
MTKFVYNFNDEDFDSFSQEKAKELLGGKGANLCEMSRMGFPVPSGFTITTKACGLYLNEGGKLTDSLKIEIFKALELLESQTGKKLGDTSNPLLVSVRSGAKFSMPGMMDTVLNLGLNDQVLNKLIDLTKNPRFGYDSYRRFIQMFGNIVSNVELKKFEHELHSLKESVGAKFDNELTADHFKSLIPKYKEIYKKNAGREFPTDAKEQLLMAIEAVFKSWNNKRAIDYRKHENIPDDIYTAVNVQAMVFGNMGETSGTGVAFTRNPATGTNEPFGEYLMNAQGEDVVAGIRNPLPISSLEKQNATLYNELVEIFGKLEEKFKDMQDCEFTIENGKLYMLQTRNGKRTGIATAKIAYDMVQEKLIDKKTAVKRLTPRDLENALFPSITWLNAKKFMYAAIDETKIDKVPLDDLMKQASTHIASKLGDGLPAGPGAASGHAIFDSDRAEGIISGKIAPTFTVTHKRKDGKPKLILIKPETSPEDFHGMVASQGILTMTGGMTSHAALVARQIGKRCIVGASASGLVIKDNVLASKDGQKIKEGDLVTIDVVSGEKGSVFMGSLPIITPTKLPAEIESILDWADEIALIKVRANADKRNDSTTAIEFKATGTGLARTEHQFFDALPTVQGFILSDTKQERQKYIDKMLQLQRKDFIDLFQVVKGKPVTIRLIDPPLHEFLPNELELREKIWKENLPKDAPEMKILDRVLFYKEANPMLGLRGVRLCLMFPEIIVMQTQAILEAALEVPDSHPEIMIPLVGFKNEFQMSRKLVDETAKKVFEKAGKTIPYAVGTMIEIPRAALTADEIAGGPLGAEFFSFGTNDLHQMTLGFSRDDIGQFLPFYLEQNIIPSDPFVTIDQSGTGQLMEMSVMKGRKAAKEAGRYLKIGICGEQGGDPESIDFCYRIGLDYVSCSPYRVPIARLSAAHATMKNPKPDAKYGKKE